MKRFNKTFKLIVPVIFVMAMFFLVETGAMAAFESFKSIGDSYVRQNLPNNNYGSSVNLNVGFYPNFNNQSITLIDFDILKLGHIKQHYIIDQATLNIYLKDWSGKLDTIEVHCVGEEWGENSVTWSSPWNNYQPNIGSIIYGSAVIGSNPGVGWKKIDVTALVQYWVSNWEEDGLALKPTGPYTNSTCTFGSREGVYTPYIDVLYHEP